MSSVHPLRVFRRRPQLSVVVVAYNMEREIKRTVHSLSPAYQRRVAAQDYELIVVDNGSTTPLSAADWIHRPGWSLRLLRLPPGNVSPCRAVNAGVAMARAEHVCVMVDGARMLSPGVIAAMLTLIRQCCNAFITTLGWHLGPEPQNLSITRGYCQAVEDKMLRKLRWREDGYRLFSASSLALSSRWGWFAPITESNCFAISRKGFQALGGFDQRFVSPGGGLVNIDFYKQAVESPQLVTYQLLGEGSFHQIHGGVATNVPKAQHPGRAFRSEYQAIRGCDYAPPSYAPVYYGSLPPETHRWILTPQAPPSP